MSMLMNQIKNSSRLWKLECRCRWRIITGKDGITRGTDGLITFFQKKVLIRILRFEIQLYKYMHISNKGIYVLLKVYKKLLLKNC